VSLTVVFVPEGRFADYPRTLSWPVVAIGPVIYCVVGVQGSRNRSERFSGMAECARMVRLLGDVVVCRNGDEAAGGMPVTDGGIEFPTACRQRMATFVSVSPTARCRVVRGDWILPAGRLDHGCVTSRRVGCKGSDRVEQVNQVVNWRLLCMNRFEARHYWAAWCDSQMY